MEGKWIRAAQRAALVTTVTAVAVGLAVAPASAVSVTSTVLVSGGGTDFSPALSHDGGFVAFVTDARLLPAQDTDQQRDVYLRRPDGGLELISQGTAQPADRPDLTPDGRYLVFQTRSALVRQDRNLVEDIYRLDRDTGEIVLVSRPDQGGLLATGNGASTGPSISADGNQVGFISAATNLVSGDTNGRLDAFVRNIDNQVTRRVNGPSPLGQAVGGDTTAVVLSGDGNWVGFTSAATNLVAGDTNGRPDVFVRNLTAGGGPQWASRPVVGSGADGAGSPTISHDGRVVGFQSTSDLAPGGSEALCTGPSAGRSADVFAFDTTTGGLTVVSVPSAAAGHDQDDIAIEPSVSADGRRFAFTSTPVQLISCPPANPDPTNPGPQEPEINYGDDRIMVRDLGTQITARVDRSTAGQFANAPSFGANISDNGAAVGYSSRATNLVAGTPAGHNVFRTGLQ